QRAVARVFSHAGPAAELGDITTVQCGEVEPVDVLWRRLVHRQPRERRPAARARDVAHARRRRRPDEPGHGCSRAAVGTANVVSTVHTSAIIMGGAFAVCTAGEETSAAMWVGAVPALLR